ncbi:MAG: hypothetical protein HGA59_01495 [Chlorobiaceae bacterium]|jgi:hypothetical protein|nr:hypothetical protein [Chlorobiaceae bacterium]NTV16905.1 hypothetical protein [Chlorobiaceae bacterium]
MESNSLPEVTPEKRSLKKGAGLLLSISVIGTICFLLVVLWINWSKPRLQPEPLSPELKANIDRIPGRSDALIYLGLKDIRESRFWKEIIPDSLKKAPLFKPQGRLDTLMRAANINPSLDIDTLVISFKRHGYKEQNYLGIVWGPFSKKLPESFLRTNSTAAEKIGGRQCYAFDSTFWLCPMGPRQIAVTNNRKMLEEFLVPTGSFLQRDSLSAALVNKALYKSHLWFALPSAAWTIGALQSLTSTNQGIKTLGNLNRIQNLAFSVKFNDGIEGQSEWVYKTRRAAFFASTFLWGAVKLSEISGTRTNEQTIQLLKKIEIRQNLESVLIHTDIPIEFFQSAKQKKQH